MFFTTKEAREERLDEIDKNPCRVCYGAAMEHARTTQLGIWSDRGALERDVAKIMLAEIRKFCYEARAKTIQERSPSIPGQSHRKLDLEERYLVDVETLRRIKQQVSELDAFKIKHTRAFSLAFTKAQSGPENQLADALDTLGVKAHNMHIHLSEEEQATDLFDVHIEIIKELIGWPRHLDIIIER